MLTLTDACTELCSMYCITNLFSLSEQMWRLQRGLSRLPASVSASRHPHTLPQLTCTPSQPSHTSHYHHSTSSHSGNSQTSPERAANLFGRTANRFETGQTGFGRGTNRSLSGQAGFARAPNQSGTSQTTIFDRDREGVREEREGVREEREGDEEEGEGGRGEGGGGGRGGGGGGGEGTRRAQLLTLATVSATAALGSLYLLLQQWRAKADGGGGVVTVMVGHMITFHFLPFSFFTVLRCGLYTQLAVYTYLYTPN